MDTWERTNGMADTNENRQAYIAALLRERESCERRALDARVREIDAELKRCGHEAKAPAQRAERRPATHKSVKR